MGDGRSGEDGFVGGQGVSFSASERGSGGGDVDHEGELGEEREDGHVRY